MVPRKSKAQFNRTNRSWVVVATIRCRGSVGRFLMVGAASSRDTDETMIKAEE